MKNITDIINEQQINEDDFGYTWQNALVVALAKLCSETGEEYCKKILQQWFGDSKSAWPLYNFLDRIDAKPKSQNVNDLMQAIKNIPITNRFTIGSIHNLN